MVTMIEVMRSAGDRVTGGETAEEAATWWREAGLTPRQAENYIEAGCWDPDSVASLIDAGVPAKALVDRDVEREYVAIRDWRSREKGGSGFRRSDLVHGLGYMHSNGDANTADIVAAFEAATR